MRMRRRAGMTSTTQTSTPHATRTNKKNCHNTSLHTWHLADLGLDLVHGAPQLREDQCPRGAARLLVPVEMVTKYLLELGEFWGATLEVLGVQHGARDEVRGVGEQVQGHDAVVGVQQLPARHALQLRGVREVCIGLWECKQKIEHSVYIASHNRPDMQTSPHANSTLHAFIV